MTLLWPLSPEASALLASAFPQLEFLQDPPAASADPENQQQERSVRKASVTRAAGPSQSVLGGNCQELPVFGKTQEISFPKKEMPKQPEAQTTAGARTEEGHNALCLKDF